MKVLISFLLFTCFAFAKPASTVFICDSKGAKAYHSSKTCSGIKKCTHEIREITLKEATDIYNRVACKICY